MRRAAVSHRVDVFAAREHQSIHAVQRFHDVSGGLDHPHLAADVEHGLAIVFELFTGGDSDERHNWFGDLAGRLHADRHLDPHEIECAGQLLADVGDTRRAPQATIGALLIQDRKLMIERAEELREPERIFSQH